MLGFVCGARRNANDHLRRLRRHAFCSLCDSVGVVPRRCIHAFGSSDTTRTHALMFKEKSGLALK